VIKVISAFCRIRQRRIIRLPFSRRRLRPLRNIGSKLRQAFECYLKSRKCVPPRQSTICSYPAIVRRRICDYARLCVLCSRDHI